MGKIDKPLKAGRLDHVSVDLQRIAFTNVFLRTRIGKNNNRKMLESWIAFDMGQNFTAAFSGQIQIKDNKIDRETGTLPLMQSYHFNDFSAIAAGNQHDMRIK